MSEDELERLLEENARMKAALEQAYETIERILSKVDVQASLVRAVGTAFAETMGSEIEPMADEAMAAIDLALRRE